MQIIQLVASESYEERVAALLETKRELFINAIEPESHEDVVGVSSRVLELALEALSKEPDPAPVEPEVEDAVAAPPTLAPAPQMDGAGVMPVRPEREDEGDDALGWLLEVVQRVLGGHLERVLATPTGLVCIVEGASEALIAEAEAHVVNGPVAIVDRRTWAALSRVAGGLVSGAREAWTRPAAAPSESPLRALARRKLEAAAALLDGHPGEALALVATAMVAALAERAGQATLPESSALAVWLYGELVPAGHASGVEANAVLRAQGLATAAEVPRHLAADVLAEGRRLVFGEG
ncbi:MAG: hypothetical protein CVU56_16635 [Deltaproteobacteria bacterium HGW-Deltaproteobacteria-14]|nr:MAG: hypothetical protein CVU56_16635 [Deltaproteobacteria bacterium HGW-Deltaproteobacteria-14]